MPMRGAFHAISNIGCADGGTDGARQKRPASRHQNHEALSTESTDSIAHINHSPICRTHHPMTIVTAVCAVAESGTARAAGQYAKDILTSVGERR
jgi:hypothetical protein